jgi:glycosyltransferase involved in cell wall biosynthesis
MFFRKGFLFYKFFNIRLFFYLLFHHFDILVSNDLDTLLPNYIVSKIKNVPVVYDSHEYFTGVPEIQSRPFVKWVWKNIERSIFPHLKYVMTVSNSIANKYESEYGMLPITVRNFSKNAGSILPYSREELGINPDDFLLILQGTGINVDRGGEELIEAVAEMDQVSVMVVGSGDSVHSLKLRVTELMIENRVRFFPKVSWIEMMRFTRTADAGVSLDKNTNLNYSFSLPNKLFDYISAGIPVIASDLPEVKRIVLENECGIIIPEVSPFEIIRAINGLKQDISLHSELKKNAVKASKSINWENESVKVKNLYRKILDSL